MAINISALSNYVEQQRLPLIRKAVLGARSTKEFNLQTGVKGDTALNLLTTNATLANGSSCGWSDGGSSVLSQRVIVPAHYKVNMNFCDKTLLSTWANHDVRVAAGQKTLPFEEDFIAGVIESVTSQLESKLWTAKTAAHGGTDLMDGMAYIIENSGYIQAPDYPAGSDVADIVDAVYSRIPSACFNGKGEVVMYMGSDMYRKYIQELIASKNIVFTTMAGAENAMMPESLIIPGTQVRLIPVGGLDNTGKAFASYRDNFVYGTDLQGDEEKFEFWYSQDNREFRLAIEFNAGVQVAYPDLVVGIKEQ